MNKGKNAIDAIEVPAVIDAPAPAPVSEAPKTVKIAKIDIKGDKNFRFFFVTPSGKVRTAKYPDAPARYKDGDELALEKVFDIAACSERQMARYRSTKKAVYDPALLL